MKLYTGLPFPVIAASLRADLLASSGVEVGEWHGQKTNGNPMLVTMEVPFVSFEFQVPDTVQKLQVATDPNLPWAEDHFWERVSGMPLNPAPSHKNWPWAHGTHHDENEKFSHTYPERFWPVMANVGEKTAQGRQIFVPHVGIRFEWGDLGDVVKCLRANSMTRQAVLPVFFPEDTGGSHRLDGARIPCSIAYHFMVRGDEMHMVYTMRSCDFVRHFRDDIYLAARLMQWMCDEVNYPDSDTNYHQKTLRPGKLMAHISSLHAMEGDRAKMEGRT